MTLRRHRETLLTAAMVLLAVDSLFIAWRYSLQAEKGWLVRMPELEQSQRTDPHNFLMSSHHWDPRLPVSSVIDPAFNPTRPDMVRDILRCRPDRIVIDGPSAELPQMPNRFYVYGERRNKLLPGCIRAKLPDGYSIAAVD